MLERDSQRAIPVLEQSFGDTWLTTPAWAKPIWEDYDHEQHHCSAMSEAKPSSLRDACPPASDLKSSPRQTPPSHLSRRSSGRLPTPPSGAADSMASKGQLISGLWPSLAPRTSGVATPLLQRSPPTPDRTPPNSRDKSHASQPSGSLSYLSSKADSFKTAKEELETSDAEATRRRPELRIQSTQEWLESTSASRLQRIGCDPGLAPVLAANATLQSELRPKWKGDVFGSLDVYSDSASSGLGAASDPELSESVVRNATMSGKRTRTIVHNHADKARDLDANGALPAAWRGLSLQSRAHRSAQSLSSNQSLPQQPESPSLVDTPPDTPPRADSQDKDSRRLSDTSGTSTIITAVILQPQPQQKRRLRHAGRNLALPASGARQSDDKSTKLGFAPHHPLRHKRSIIADSHASPPEDSDVALPRVRNDVGSWVRALDAIATVPAPSDETPTILESRQTASLLSQQLFSNPTGGDSTTPSVLPLLRTAAGHSSTGRSAEEPNKPHSPIVTWADGEFRVTQQWPLHSPRSSPFRPDSVDSIASAVIQPPPKSTIAERLHFAALEAVALASRNHPPPPPRASIDRPTGVGDDYPWLRFDHVGLRADELVLRRNRFGASPMSQLSDAAEALEVSEATAVSIYPHNNGSVLVVQQPARPLSQRYTRTSVLDGQPSVTDPEIPTNRTPPRSAPLVDSPLINPRKPPEPPKLRIIPPTPDCSASDRQLHLDSDNADEAKSPPVRRTSLVQRARRYSSSIIQPLLRAPSLRRTPSKRAPVPMTPEPSPNLHPFWRPRGFWDDFSSDDDEEDFGEGLPSGGIDYEDEQIPRASVRFSGLGAFLIGNAVGVQRAPTNGRLHRVVSPSRGAGSKRGTSNLEEGGAGMEKAASGRRAPREGNGNRDGNRVFSGLGVQVEYVGWRGLRDRMRVARVAKEEWRREVRRERLKRSIGARWVVEGVRVGGEG